MLGAMMMSFFVMACGGGGSPPPPPPPGGGGGPDRSAYTLRVDGPLYTYAGGATISLGAHSDIVVFDHVPRWTMEGPGTFTNPTPGTPDPLVGWSMRYTPPVQLPNGPIKVKFRFTVYNILRKADQTSPDGEVEVRVVEKPMELSPGQNQSLERTIKAGEQAVFGLYVLPVKPLGYAPQVTVNSVTPPVANPGRIVPAIESGHNIESAAIFEAPPTVTQDYDVVLTYTAWDPWFNKQANTLTFTVHVKKP